MLYNRKGLNYNISPELNNLLKYTIVGAMIAFIVLGITFLVSSIGIQDSLTLYSALLAIFAIILSRSLYEI